MRLKSSGKERHDIKAKHKLDSIKSSGSHFAVAWVLALVL